MLRGLAAVELYNLARIDEVEDTSMVISRNLEMVWAPSAKPKFSAGTFHIKRFKPQSDTAMVTLRSTLISSALCELTTDHQRIAGKQTATGTGDRLARPVCPLAKLINY